VPARTAPVRAGPAEPCASEGIRPRRDTALQARSRSGEMTEALKQWLRSYGVTKQHLNFPQYYLPYLFGGGRAFVPQSLALELTFRCNLSCVMCPLDLPRAMHSGEQKEFVKERKAVELTSDEVHAIIDDIAAFGVESLTLTGGEAFLRHDILEIIEHVKQTPMKLCVNTNGWYIREKQAQRLVELGVDGMSVSIDGPDATHDEIRRGKGSFKRLAQGIANVSEAKKALGKQRPYVGITCTIFSRNQHNFSEVIDGVKDLGVTSVDFEYMFFTTQQAIDQTRAMIPLPYRPKEENQIVEDDLRQVDPDIFMAQVKAAEAKGAEYGIPVSFGPPFKSKEQIRRRFHDPNHAFVEKCFYPWKSARINPYGDVYSCSIDVDFGNVREAPFSQIWNNESYRTFRKTLKERQLFPKCAKCCALNNQFWQYLPTP
jgi:radical SAM protein with 4Fe4S-binding SPASM domain